MVKLQKGGFGRVGLRELGIVRFLVTSGVSCRLYAPVHIRQKGFRALSWLPSPKYPRILQPKAQIILHPT